MNISGVRSLKVSFPLAKRTMAGGPGGRPKLFFSAMVDSAAQCPVCRLPLRPRLRPLPAQRARAAVWAMVLRRLHPGDRSGKLDARHAHQTRRVRHDVSVRTPAPPSFIALLNERTVSSYFGKSVGLRAGLLKSHSPWYRRIQTYTCRQAQECEINLTAAFSWT